MKRHFKNLLLLCAVIIFTSSTVMASEEVKTEPTQLNKLHEKARRVPVLMYHEVGYQPEGEFSDANYVLRENFQGQMYYLAANGFKTITMEQLYDNWKNGTELPEKPVVLTFDDGYASHFSFVNDVLTRFKLKGTFYIIQDRLSMGMEGRDLEGLKKIADSGMEIGVHTYSHPDLKTISIEAAREEIMKAKTFLETELDRKITTFSYPYGSYNAELIEEVKNAGFNTAVLTRKGIADPFKHEVNNEYMIERYNIGFDTSIDSFISIINSK